MPRILTLLALLAAHAAPFSAGAADAPIAPEALEGRIYRAEDLRELQPDELLARFDEARVIYLGEKHDNAHHHERQLEVLRLLVERGRRPAIGFEVFSVDQTSTLMGYATWKAPKSQMASGLPPPEQRLRNALGWDEAHDDNWSFYGPLLEFAREEGLIVFGIDLPRALRRRIARAGIDGLTNVERRQLHPSGFDPGAYADYVRARLRHMHCGHGSDAYIERLYATWRVRNDTMAMAITETATQIEGEPVVVITGAGHVLHDMGAYARVAHLSPGIAQINLAFRQVPAEAEPLKETVHPHPIPGARRADDHAYVWFTPRGGEQVEDPCEQFRRMHKRSG